MDPPEFDFENLGDILGSLSQEDIDRLSSLAGQFMGTEKAEETCREEPVGGFDINPDMLFRIASIFEKLNSSRNDPRCNLICALKPMLSPARREKADTAIELLKLMSILSAGDLFNTEG